jgi:hypothetical protein
MLACKTSQLACHQFTSNRSPRSPRRSRIAFRPCAIGFDLTGSTSSKSAEKCADELSRAASSLLVYRGVLSSRPAQSFMEVLLHLQKGSPLKLLDHYGELYKSINNEGLSSWKDYLLDQVLRGADNPFAKAAARGEPTAHLLPSVRHDMNVIQQLSVSEATLAGWVRETVSSVSEDWMIAATTMSSTNGEGSNGSNIATHGSLDMPNDPPTHILAALTKHQRSQLRSRLCQEDAAVLLQKYHAAHDYGILSMHRVLKWSQDRLKAQDVLEGVVNSTITQNNEAERSAAEVLVAALDAGLLCLDLTNRAQGAEPILMEGCSRKAYTIAMHVLNNLETLVSSKHAFAAKSVRVIILPHSQLSTISELAWTMSQHPRMYFAVVCPDVGKEISSDVAATIAGEDGVSWPANAVFIGCSDTAPSGL